GPELLRPSRKCKRAAPPSPLLANKRNLDEGRRTQEFSRISPAASYLDMGGSDDAPTDKPFRNGGADMKQRFRDPFIAALVVTFLGARAVCAQPLNPSYLAEMPPPPRVLAEIKGKDAEDTGERQMGAFMALIQIMDEM